MALSNKSNLIHFVITYVKGNPLLSNGKDGGVNSTPLGKMGSKDPSQWNVVQVFTVDGGGKGGKDWNGLPIGKDLPIGGKGGGQFPPFWNGWLKGSTSWWGGKPGGAPDWWRAK